MNQQIILIAITLSVLSISSVSTSYAASLDSPLYQLQNGVDPKDIQCNENLVLVLRADGSPACVQESSADKLGWEIINTFPIVNIITERPPPQTTTLDLSSPVEFVDDGREIKTSILQKRPAPAPMYDIIMESMNDGVSVNSKGIAIVTSQGHEKYSIDEGVGLYAEDWMPTYIPDGQKLLYTSSSCHESGNCGLGIKFVPTTYVLNQNVTNYDLQFSQGFHVGVSVSKTSIDEIEDNIEFLKEGLESQSGNYGRGYVDMTRDGKTILAYEGGNDYNSYQSVISFHPDEFTSVGVSSTYYTLDELIPIFESIMK